MASSKYTAYEVITGALKWAQMIAEKDKYTYKNWESDPNTHKCPICNPGSGNGWNCIGFITACYYHGGGLRGNLKCYCGGLGVADWNNTDPGTKKFNDHNGPGWKKITTDGRIKASDSNFKKHCNPGDVIILYKTKSGNSYIHTAMYYGWSTNSKTALIAESSSSNPDGKKVQYRRKNHMSGWYMNVYRFVGPGSSKNKKPYDNSSIKISTLPQVVGTGKCKLRRIKKSSSAEDVRKGAVAWAKAIAKDNNFHYGYGYHSHHNGCYFCGTQHNKKGHGIKDYEWTYCCNPFVTAAYAHGGGAPDCLKRCRGNSSYCLDTRPPSKYWKLLKNPSIKDLIAGDMMIKKHGSHVKMYIGDKKQIQAEKEDDNKKGSSDWKSSISISSCKSVGDYYVYRYTGKGGEWMTLPTYDGNVNADYDTGDEIKIVKVQLEVDGYKGISKNGKCRIGEAAGTFSHPEGGDQSNELRIKDWYCGNGGGYNDWTHVFRFKDDEKSLKAAKIVRDACNNKNVGYETGTTEFFSALKKHNYDASKITEKVGVACSQLVSAAVNAVGIKIKLNVNANMLKNELISKSSKKHFECHTKDEWTHKCVKAQPGDIYITAGRPHNHAMMVIATKNGIITSQQGVRIAGNYDLTGDEKFVDDGSSIVLEKEISKLYSSENYSYVEQKQNEENESITKFKDSIQRALDAQFTSITTSSGSGATIEFVIDKAIKDLNYDYEFDKNKAKRLKDAQTTNLISFPSLVQAPTIVLDFNGVRIGGYGNKGDIYPNYIESMSVNKINGRINRYMLNLGYQIRPGEDPNFIDKLLSRTGYQNRLKILYGDSMSPEGFFREDEAIITDVKHHEDPGSCKITYNISAISSIGVPKSTSTFGTIVDKPSSQIYKLLYDSGEVSEALLLAFPGMRDKRAVASRGLIPVSDSSVKIGGLKNASALSRLTHLVCCMKSAAGNSSSYFITFHDDNSMNGSYFKITEVKKISSGEVLSTDGAVYSVDINYPTDNFITSFQVCNNNYWSMVYDFAGDIPYFNYNIDRDGNLSQEPTNILFSNLETNNESLIKENWWKQITEFPISAKLRLKGLVTPAMLMSYINVNAYYYGQRDMASGLYVVTEENDTISGSGYTTELTLLRVADD